MPTYELVNPYIIGDMKKSFDADDSKTAANDAWGTLSQYITNNVPKFAFTMKNLQGGKLHHFVVKEKLRNKEVDYSLKELKLTLSKSEEKAFVQHITKMAEDKKNKISGGSKKHKDDKDDSPSESGSDSESSRSSDSSSESDIYKKIRHFKNKNQPLNYMWYSPIVYSKDGTLESVYLPSFTYPIVPYLEIGLSTLVFKL
jgi:hypothetical protein